MPVPNLAETCQKLLDWSAPLLTEQERTTSEHVVQQFLLPDRAGEKLQQNLINWGQQSQADWSGPVWQNLYLRSRDSLVINSNVFYYLKSKLDKTLATQARVAAALVSCVYSFIEMIDSESLTVDMQKDIPLCMNQYRNIFSSIRRPRTGEDEFCVSSSRAHIVVMAHQSVYLIDVIDNEGNIRSAVDIECDLQWIIKQPTQAKNIGILTTQPRDDWAEEREYLINLCEHNRDAMIAIEQAAFVLCLDEQSPEAISDISRQLLHGSGRDRFFDKSLQFIVFNNGKSGINFEHTGVDGSVMMRLIAHIYNTIDQVSFADKSEVGATYEHKVRELSFELDNHLNLSIDRATCLFQQHIANTQTKVLNFTRFGKNQIKQFGVSPDAFVQLALQLAEYKLYGKCYSAYEAVMTRTFRDGRIDVLYTVSPESMAFIHAIQSVTCSVQEKKDALIRATQKHVARAKECRFGQGVYTHFLALKYRYEQVGQQLGIAELPAIFTDSAYRKLTHSVVCTSTTSEYGVELAGYGPIVDDGYGIRYFTRGDAICFNMTSRTEMLDKLEQMEQYIEQSLLEMAQLMSN